MKVPPKIFINAIEAFNGKKYNMAELYCRFCFDIQPLDNDIKAEVNYMLGVLYLENKVPKPIKPIKVENPDKFWHLYYDGLLYLQRAADLHFAKAQKYLVDYFQKLGDIKRSEYYLKKLKSDKHKVTATPAQPSATLAAARTDTPTDVKAFPVIPYTTPAPTLSSSASCAFASQPQTYSQNNTDSKIQQQFSSSSFHEQNLEEAPPPFEQEDDNALPPPYEDSIQPIILTTTLVDTKAAPGRSCTTPTSPLSSSSPPPYDHDDDDASSPRYKYDVIQSIPTTASVDSKVAPVRSGPTPTSPLSSSASSSSPTRTSPLGTTCRILHSFNKAVEGYKADDKTHKLGQKEKLDEILNKMQKTDSEIDQVSILVKERNKLRLFEKSHSDLANNKKQGAYKFIDNWITQNQSNIPGKIEKKKTGGEMEYTVKFS